MTTETGKIVRGNRPVTPAVPVQLHTSDHPTPNEWSGRITLPEGTDADLGRARLLLADGRSGDMVMYRLDAGAGRTIVIDFWGVGSLKKTG